MNNKKTLPINLITNLVTLAFNIGINLLVMPFIVNRAGAEAYGFVGLANSIVNYAAIITIALNSVSSRYIAISVHQGRKKSADEYFNSVFWTDLILCVVISSIGIWFSMNISSFMKTPAGITEQVQQLFLWLVLNFSLSVIATVFTVSAYITNKLYLSNIVNTLAIMIKAVSLLALFTFFSTNIAYIGAASALYSLIVLVLHIGLTKLLTPELVLKFKYFSWSKTFEMFRSGIWSSISKISSTLSDGLDAVITNLFLNGAALGALSVAYMIPSVASTLLSSVCTLFNPQLTYYYAKHQLNEILGELKTNMKLTGIFSCILFCGIIHFGKEFFVLMTPNENISLIYSLTCLSSISLVASGITAGLANVFLLTDKLKVNSIVWLTISIFDILLVLFLLKTTSLGVYAVAGVSKIIGGIVNLTYLPIYACKCLDINKITFYPLIIRYFLVVMICLAAFGGVKAFTYDSYSWGHLLTEIFICSIIGVLINGLFFLNKEERKNIVKQMKNRR